MNNKLMIKENKIINPICKICGKEFQKKDNRKYGIALIAVGILLFPLISLISYGTITPIVSLILFLALGLYRLLKKDRFFYYCKRCSVKISEQDLKK